MRKITFTAALALVTFMVQAQDKPEDTEVWKPVPKVIQPGTSTNTAPSDAIILFDGKNLNHWESEKGGPAQWTISGGAMTVKKGTGVIKSKEKFEDFQLHIEFRTPEKVVGEGQGRGNSGIFMQSYYELQVLDNYNNVTYSNGQAGSFYKQRIPLVNACKKPGEWQTYDVIWTAPRFNEDGSLKSPARATVLQNGVLVQNNVSLDGETLYIGKPSYKAHGAMPFILQDHGNPVSYRNIWVRRL
ncbi:hypothetical protein COR50_18530 [Chitinophaga caeni]|uniref:3-keto-alpha-glucoside-1,2-lyase/3-keto-2-hydroxy-glucal hydratase domain-containing protein n=1 Tax=Chitinophaga caeni TaxID=2029983 RepID=A0A291QYS0_9BACT|nr:DUF1080 domain-containing protein [Chitinophaga caeni]ATL49004.1 hypothetical protein COR50_18530 [Chitinophaga caeni]